LSLTRRIVNFIFYYGTTFFQRSGISNPFLITIATSIVNVFMTLPGMWGVEKFGRRTLLLVGAAGMAICEFIVAIVGVTVSVENVAAQKVLIAFVCIYIAFFASTWGPVAWVITGEIFPLQVRAKAMSLSVASNWLWNFAIGYASKLLIDIVLTYLDLTPLFQPHTLSTRRQALLALKSRCFSSGARPALAALSSPTSAFPRHVLPPIGYLIFTLTLRLSDQGLVSRADRPHVPEHHPRQVPHLPKAPPGWRLCPQGRGR
jgi:MFS family permease